MPVMTVPETTTFLAERQRLLRLGTVDVDCRPHVVPVWYLPIEGALLITPRSASAWLLNLEANAWVCAVVDEDMLPYRKVIVSTQAEVLYEPGDDAAWRDVYRTLCLRYWDEDAVDPYMASTIHVRRALISVPLRLGTTEVQTWRLPVADEDPRGIWASRYGRPILGSGASSANC